MPQLYSDRWPFENSFFCGNGVDRRHLVI